MTDEQPEVDLAITAPTRPSTAPQDTSDNESELQHGAHHRRHERTSHSPPVLAWHRSRGQPVCCLLLGGALARGEAGALCCPCRGSCHEWFHVPDLGAPSPTAQTILMDVLAPRRGG
jgi:hypothetical protein